MGLSYKNITSRDRMILTMMARHGCVSAKHIKKNFWEANDQTDNHYRRIGFLKKLKLIENVLGDGGHRIGYRLTRKGKKFMTLSKSDYAAKLIRRAYRTPLDHDYKLIDIKQILERSPIIKNFKTEGEIRHEILKAHSKLLHWESSPLLPDASFEIHTPDRTMRVAVELEMTSKTKRRYTRIFRKHLLSKHWDFVIYIAKDDKLMNRLIRCYKEIRGKDIELKIAKSVNGFYLCTLDEFIKNQLGTQLVGEQETISLTEIAQFYEKKGAR